MSCVWVKGPFFLKGPLFCPSLQLPAMYERAPQLDYVYNIGLYILYLRAALSELSYIITSTDKRAAYYMLHTGHHDVYYVVTLIMPI